MLLVKHSVADLIRNGDDILECRRPDDDEELHGGGGLPAGTIRGAETVEDLITRIGKEKLGVRLTPVQRLAHGVQTRPRYRLEMDLWEAVMDGMPEYPEWKWGTVEVLRPGMAAGSL